MFEGHLADGVTAQRRPVRVRLSGQYLHVYDPEGKALDTWPLKGLRLAEEVYRGQPVRLMHADRDDACLTVTSQGILEPLLAHLPRVRRRLFVRGSTAGRVVFWTLAVVGLCAGLMLAVPHLARPVARAVPMGWEQAFGRQVVHSMVPTRCTGAAGQAALDRIVGRLSAVQDSPYTFQVSVADTDRVNAFATPGGYIVVFRGLIDSADTPDEVAGVLAHEMGHVIRRHPTQAMVRSLGFRVVAGAFMGDASGLASSAADLGRSLLELSYSRQDEAEADRVGAGLLRRSGIGTAGLVAFFNRLRKAHPDRAPGALRFLASHPGLSRRIRALGTPSTPSRPVLSPGQWQALKQICTGSPE
ncbi:MAG TPA: M48 family metallopeptidase [Gammaproteobacteria bacterium]|nr:M48 family metallopeptidase [Gammaproteobacteria bacterium]